MSKIADVEIKLGPQLHASFVKVNGEEIPFTEVKIECGIKEEVPKVTLTFPAKVIQGLIKEGKLNLIEVKQ